MGHSLFLRAPDAALTPTRLRFLPLSAGPAPSSAIVPALGNPALRIPPECPSVAAGYENRAIAFPCVGLVSLESENWLEPGENSGR